jgi:hypothetical protein
MENILGSCEDHPWFKNAFSVVEPYLNFQVINPIPLIFTKQ